MIIEYKFNNGDKVKEKVTGFTGIVTGAVSYMTGCNQYLVTAKSRDESSEAKTILYDEGRLVLVNSSEVEPSDTRTDDNGGDRQAPIK